jgi:hypothetical protein
MIGLTDTFARGAINARKSRSPVRAAKNGARRFAPVPRAKFGALFDLSKTPRLKFLDKLCAEHRTREQSRSLTEQHCAEVSALVTALNERAELEGWSQRELAKRAALSWRTWGRIRSGQVNAAEWLPKLRAAVARLNKGETIHV